MPVHTYVAECAWNGGYNCIPFGDIFCCSVFVLRMYLWWSLCTLYLLACQVTYFRRLRSLLCLCDVFRAQINSLVC